MQLSFTRKLLKQRFRSPSCSRRFLLSDYLLSVCMSMSLSLTHTHTHTLAHVSRRFAPPLISKRRDQVWWHRLTQSVNETVSLGLMPKGRLAKGLAAKCTGSCTYARPDKRLPGTGGATAAAFASRAKGSVPMSLDMKRRWWRQVAS